MENDRRFLHLAAGEKCLTRSVRDTLRILERVRRAVPRRWVRSTCLAARLERARHSRPTRSRWRNAAAVGQHDFRAPFKRLNCAKRRIAEFAARRKHSARGLRLADAASILREGNTSVRKARRDYDSLGPLEQLGGGRRVVVPENRTNSPSAFCASDDPPAAEASKSPATRDDVRLRVVEPHPARLEEPESTGPDPLGSRSHPDAPAHASGRAVDQRHIPGSAPARHRGRRARSETPGRRTPA